MLTHGRAHLVFLDHELAVGVLHDTLAQPQIQYPTGACSRYVRQQYNFRTCVQSSLTSSWHV